MLSWYGLASNLHRREVVCHLSWKLLSDKANPMDIVVDLIPFPSIYKSLFFFFEQASDSSSIVLVILRIPEVQEIEAARAFFAPIRPNLSEEILVTKEREACFPSQQALQDMCC